MPIDRGMAIGAGTANSMSVVGMKELQQKLQRLQEKLDPYGGLYDAMGIAIGMVHRYASAIVPVDTGRYKNSLFWTVGRGMRGVTGRMGTNVEYAISVERMGGRRATFARTMKEEVPNAVKVFNDLIDEALED